MSILSERPDGFGFHYGFMPGDHRQINVQRQPSGGWFAYVGGELVGRQPTKEQAEECAIAWAKLTKNEDGDHE